MNKETRREREYKETYTWQKEHDVMLVIIGILVLYVVFYFGSKLDFSLIFFYGLSAALMVFFGITDYIDIKKSKTFYKPHLETVYENDNYLYPLEIQKKWTPQ